MKTLNTFVASATNRCIMISEETRRKMSESAKKRVARGVLPNNKGKTPWNKGKTADEDPRIAAYAEKQTGQKREGNYVSSTHWKGEGNPWYGKPRNGPLHPCYQEHRHSREYWDFYNKVVWATEKTYVDHKEDINPDNHPRTLAGVDGGYQLDHIVSIDYGWKNKMTVEELSCKENLQMLSWQDNRNKSNKVII
jgi:hypothetical protein